MEQYIIIYHLFNIYIDRPGRKSKKGEGQVFLCVKADAKAALFVVENMMATGSPLSIASIIADIRERAKFFYVLKLRFL